MTDKKARRGGEATTLKLSHSFCGITVQHPMLTLSVPQDIANVIKTKSRLRVWVRKSSYLAGLSGFFSVVLQKSSISWLKKKKKKKKPTYNFSL